MLLKRPSTYFLASILFLSGCSLKSEENGLAQLSIQTPVLKTSSVSTFSNPPLSLSGFQCFGVNAIGPGIQAPFGNFDLFKIHLDLTLNPPKACSYPGITKGFYGTSPTQLSLTVPTGPKRVIQLFGIKDASSNLCEYLVQTSSLFDDPQNSDSEIYELGRAVVDVQGNLSVTLQSQWSNYSYPEKLLKRMDCEDDIEQMSMLLESGSEVYTMIHTGQGVGYIGGKNLLPTCNGCINAPQPTALLKVDFNTKRVLKVFPFPASSEVHALETDGNHLYIGGVFLNYEGFSRTAFVRFSLANDEFDPSMDMSITPVSMTTKVYALKKHGDDLFIGGTFNDIQSSGKLLLAKIDLPTLTVDSGFTPTPAGSGIKQIRTTSTEVFVSGTFTTMSGNTRNQIASVDQGTGAIGGFDVGTVTGSISNFFVNESENRVYVGGTLSYIGGGATNKLAILDATTGSIDSTFNPTVSGTTVSSFYYESPKLYLGGLFTIINAMTANRIAVLDITTLSAPSFLYGEPNTYTGEVKTVLKVGSTVFWGGDTQVTENGVTYNGLKWKDI